MATDKRELVLLRLQAILGTIAGIAPAQVYRDRGEFDEERKIPVFPIAILLDGFERKFSEGRDGRGDAVLPMLVDLTPQIFVLMKPKILANAAEYGPEISGWRAKVLKAIFFDVELLALLGSNGGIDYRGMDTDMQTGRTMEGQIQFNFVFRYVLNPNDL